MPVRNRNSHSFSLVEVVIALGIISFALVSIVGLFGFGVQTNKGSSDQIQAANVASLIVASLRGSPTGLTNCALYPTITTLNQSITATTASNMAASSTPIKIGLDGMPTSIVTNQVYNLEYSAYVSPNSPYVANVYLLLWWPPQAAKPVSGSGNYYQLSTQVALPLQ